jgi:hypothetical protein
MRPRALVLLLAVSCAGRTPDDTCGQAACGAVGDLSASDFACTDTGGCNEIAWWSKGCMGSHLEQDCTTCGRTFVRLTEGDAADLYFEDGELVAVERKDRPTDACATTWYGLDLSACEPVGEPRRVRCDGTGGDGTPDPP